jgi:hypothetical protein
MCSNFVCRFSPQTPTSPSLPRSQPLSYHPRLLLFLTSKNGPLLQVLLGLPPGIHPAPMMTSLLPAPGLDPKVGELYVHTNRTTDHHEVWLFDLSRSWKCVTDVVKVYHPVIADRVLSIRVNGTPSWITAASYMTIRGRKERAKAAE